MTLTDAAGSQGSDRIESLTPSVMSLDSSGVRRDSNEADVTAIGQSRGDLLAHGDWWGFGVGIDLIRRPQVVYRRPGLAMSLCF